MICTVAIVVLTITWCSTAFVASGSSSSSATAYSPKDVVRDYCEAEKFRPSCSHDEVIEMKQAVYGRMKLGRCVKLDMGHLGCKDDVLDLADELCSGRRSCEISIPEQNFELMRPCLELKSYFEASYTCIKVQTIDSVDCTKPLRARLPSGRIASSTTNESRCVSTYDTTWLIHGAPGQRVNISLLDFRAAVQRRRAFDDSPRSNINSDNGADTTCHKYATLTELPDTWSSQSPAGGSTDYQQLRQQSSQPYRVVGQTADQTMSPTAFKARSSVVCGRRSRLQHVYTSTSHVVEIKLEWHRANPNYFVLFYEVFGCPDPQLPSTMWFQRQSDNEATVGCKLSAGTWRLTCGANNEWTGDTGNCTQYETFELAVRSTSMETTNNAGLMTAVLCICAFFIAILVIVTGVILHRRRRRRGLGRSSKSGGGGSYDVTLRGHAVPKSDYGGVPEDYDDDLVIGGGDMAYVFPSRGHGDDAVGSSTWRQRHSGGSDSVCDSVAYDVVDGLPAGKLSTSDGPYEKVSSCRYVHIWEMPLPKAPDE